MVLCLGLTPALQRTLIFRDWQLDEVNRAGQVMTSAAGKSLNTARALAALGIECRTAGFNGGHNGELIKGFLQQYGVDSALTAMAAETRICTTLIDESAGTVTELVEEAPQPSEHEIADFIRCNTALVKESQMLVLCGTLPPWAPDDFYLHFTHAAREAQIPVVIDSHRGALLAVLAERPALVKLNFRELELTFKERITSESQLEELMGRLIAGGAESVFLTQGKSPSYLLEGQKFSRHPPPEIRQHRNPIGSGDCTTAGIVCALINGRTLQEAVKLGLACGSANVESLLPADITYGRVRELLG